MITPLVLLLAASCGAPAFAQDSVDPSDMISAAKAQAANQQKTAAVGTAAAKAAQAAAPQRNYPVPSVNAPDAEEFRRFVAMLTVHHSEVGGGPEHIGSLIGGPCYSAPTSCVALVEPLHDWVVEDGDKTSPYVYAMLDKVLWILGDRLGSFAAIGRAQSQLVYLAGLPPYVGPGAELSAQDSLRRLLASTQSVSYDASDVHVSEEARGRNAPLCRIGADDLGLFGDAPAALRQPLHAMILSKDPDTAVSALKSLARLEPVQGTLDLMRPLLVDGGGPRRDVPTKVQVQALKETGDLAWKLWRQRWTETARPYRDAVKSLGQDARGDDVKGGYAGNHDVAEAAEGAFRSFPHPPGETTNVIPARP